MDTPQECNLDSDGIPLCKITQEKLQQLNQKIRAITIYDVQNGILGTPHPAAAGRGSINPVIMFIGEALGENEEIQRSPFVGRAGQVLNEVMCESGIDDIRHYITNVVKMRPTIAEGSGDAKRLRNRPPTDDEVGFWEPFLRKEIELLQPKILVGLGAVASAWLLGWPLENTKMGKIHGNIGLDAYLRADVPFARIMPSYHPAATFHRPEVRDIMIRDFKSLKVFLQTIHSKE